MPKVYGHGRLIDPPSRSSAWRFGFKTQINYNDNELFCGGFTTQWKLNNGKCGICGDPYNGLYKANEIPNGKYAKQMLITKTYISGQIIDAKVQLTANHHGYFVFKICPALSDIQEVTQQCLDNFQLKVLNSNFSDKYIVPTNEAKVFTITLKLPNRLSCKRCVFQWTYTAGNNWGKCGDGTSAVGCGPQETFRGCADVRILAQNHTVYKIFSITPTIQSTLLPPLTYVPDNDINYDDNLVVTKSTITTTFTTTPSTTTQASNHLNVVSNNDIKYQNTCKSTGIWSKVSNMDDWCRTNCAQNYCPPSHCACN